MRLALACAILSAVSAAQTRGEAPIRPGHPEWPVAWAAYRTVVSLEADFADLKAHGVGLVSIGAKDAAEAGRLLALARRTGMKYHIELPEITENAELIRAYGLEPVDALMIGGVYLGKAIDRHLFEFRPGRQQIVIEPPVYNARYAYSRGGEAFAHYYPEMPAPVRAEVVVPLKEFDGRQHLRIVPAQIEAVPGSTALERDSVTTDMPATAETRSRTLYRLSFDLSGLDGALLGQVGVAVYWRYGGARQHSIFGRGMASAPAPATREAARRSVRDALKPWTEANGGTFPLDVVLAARFGNECFYTTGHTQDHSLSVSFPLWDYSAPSIEAFRKRLPSTEYPRTWGFPKIYGPDAYAWWLYLLHENCASLAGVVKEEATQLAPGLLVFRNTTRAGVFSTANDHDGSGPELLTRNLDIVHLDPYPLSSAGYRPAIPRDMNYYSGLARRYNRLLIPWMQAHTYSTGSEPLVHVKEEEVARMAGEHWLQGPDAVMWPGYGRTFPKERPAWERAAEFDRQLAAMPAPKPRAQLAVLRWYRPWALSSLSDGRILNPADWVLQQWLELWAVAENRPYDVFEVPPGLSESGRAALRQELKKYRRVVSTEPWPGALVITGLFEGSFARPDDETRVRRRLAGSMERWLRK